LGGAGPNKGENGVGSDIGTVRDRVKAMDPLNGRRRRKRKRKKTNKGIICDQQHASVCKLTRRSPTAVALVSLIQV